MSSKSTREDQRIGVRDRTGRPLPFYIVALQMRAAAKLNSPDAISTWNFCRLLFIESKFVPSRTMCQI